jgi:hypothetical protein
MRRDAHRACHSIRYATRAAVKLYRRRIPAARCLRGSGKTSGGSKGPFCGGSLRAPYFHNGFAKNLEAVIDFYDSRFGIGFNDEEKRDLVAFLRAL